MSLELWTILSSTQFSTWANQNSTSVNSWHSVIWLILPLPLIISGWMVEHRLILTWMNYLGMIHHSAAKNLWGFELTIKPSQVGQERWHWPTNGLTTTRGPNFSNSRSRDNRAADGTSWQDRRPCLSSRWPGSSSSSLVPTCRYGWSFIELNHGLRDDTQLNLLS